MTLDKLTKLWKENATDGKPTSGKTQSIQRVDVYKPERSVTLQPRADTAKIQAETKALSNYCHTIINSAAFLYVD